jgi:hypothetical protein
MPYAALSGQVPDLGKCEILKVFWFFSSEKNMLFFWRTRLAMRQLGVQAVGWLVGLQESADGKLGRPEGSEDGLEMGIQALVVAGVFQRPRRVAQEHGAGIERCAGEAMRNGAQSVCSARRLRRKGRKASELCAGGLRALEIARQPSRPIRLAGSKHAQIGLIVEREPSRRLDRPCFGRWGGSDRGGKVGAHESRQ